MYNALKRLLFKDQKIDEYAMFYELKKFTLII